MNDSGTSSCGDRRLHVVEQLATLAGVPVDELAAVCRKWWRPGDLERAAIRLEVFAISTPPRGARESSREKYRREVREAVARGLAPSTRRAIELIAQANGVAAGTVHDALYRRARSTPGCTPDKVTGAVQSSAL